MPAISHLPPPASVAFALAATPMTSTRLPVMPLPAENFVALAGECAVVVGQLVELLEPKHAQVNALMWEGGEEATH